MTTPKLTDDEQVVVWQAEGVLMEMLGCEVAAAALLLRWRALREGRSVADTASGVLSGVAVRGRGDQRGDVWPYLPASPIP